MDDSARIFFDEFGIEGFSLHVIGQCKPSSLRIKFNGVSRGNGKCDDALGKGKVNIGALENFGFDCSRSLLSHLRKPVLASLVVLIHLF